MRFNIAFVDAKEILENYFAAFPSVRAYMDATVAEARHRGYTETLFGRRRPIPNWPPVTDGFARPLNVRR